MKVKRICLVLLLITMIVPGTFAQRHNIDIRTMNEIGNNSYITFHAYPMGTMTLEGKRSLAGHVFVEFHGQTSNQSVNVIRGMLREEVRQGTNYSYALRGVRTEDTDVLILSATSLRVRVNSHQFERALAVSIPDRYFLMINDCVTYAAEVARALNLVVMDMAAFMPMNFLSELIYYNR